MDHVSCGGVVFRNTKKGLEILLLHKFKKDSWEYDSWHLPKGTREVGETEEECAKREINEETGYEVKILKKLGSFKSSDQWGDLKFSKNTIYFICQPLQKTATGDSEHDEVKWIPFEKAKKLLAEFPIWEAEEKVLEKFQKLYNQSNA